MTTFYKLELQNKIPLTEKKHLKNEETRTHNNINPYFWKSASKKTGQQPRTRFVGAQIQQKRNYI
jgi:hypothetical protein